MTIRYVVSDKEVMLPYCHFCGHSAFVDLAILHFLEVLNDNKNCNKLWKTVNREHLAALLLGEAADLSPACMDRRLPVAQSAACVWVGAAHDVSAKSPAVVHRLLPASQLSFKLLQAQAHQTNAININSLQVSILWCCWLHGSEACKLLQTWIHHTTAGNPISSVTMLVRKQKRYPADKNLFQLSSKLFLLGQWQNMK